MSQHQIEVNSPKVGPVLVTVGYDPMLNEAFLNFSDEKTTSYMSPSGLVVSDINRLAEEKLGVLLPQTVIDGVQKDVADLRTGANDVGRRYTEYEPDGTVRKAAKW